MAGNWGATIAVHFPRPALRGEGTFNGESVVLANGVVFYYTFAAAAFVGDTQFAANAILQYTSSAEFAGQASMTAAGSVQLPTIYHIIISGQSNGSGTGGGVGYSQTAVAPKGRKFTGGERPGVLGLSSLVPYTGADVTCDGQSIGESLCYYLGNKISGNPTILISNVAVGGLRLLGVSKGSGPYNNSLAQIQAAKNIATSVGADYRVLAICLLNGEADYALSYSGDFAQWMLALYEDYNADIQLVNPGNPPVRTYWSQTPNNGGPVDAGQWADANRRMYEKAISDPSKVILCGGNRSHYELSDNLHLAATGQRKIGEIYARAIYEKEFLNVWAPFYAVSAVRTGNLVDITFSTPFAPIRFDFAAFPAVRITNHVFGFAFHDSTSSATVIDAEVTGANTVRVTLSVTPTGTSQHITYGYSGLTTSGRLAGRTGPLVDSRFTGLRYPELANPCPSFDIYIT